MPGSSVTAGTSREEVREFLARAGEVGRDLGRPAREVGAEIWPEIGPRIETVLESGEATRDEALPLILERSGFREETYHTFSYSPLPDDEAVKEEREFLDAAGEVLGTNPRSAMIELAPYDTLLLYTDGLIERNPRVRGDAGLRDLLASLPCTHVAELLEELECRALGSPPGRLLDDTAVLAIQATTRAPGGADPEGAGASVLAPALAE